MELWKARAIRGLQNMGAVKKDNIDDVKKTEGIRPSVSLDANNTAKSTTNVQGANKSIVSPIVKQEADSRGKFVDWGKVQKDFRTGRWDYIDELRKKNEAENKGVRFENAKNPESFIKLNPNKTKDATYENNMAIKRAEMEKVVSDSDFEERSADNKKEGGKGFSIGNIKFDFSIDPKKYEDVGYRFSNDGAGMTISDTVKRALDPESKVSVYEFLTENEKKIYNYYYNKYGPEKANEYIDTFIYDLHKRRSDEQYEKYKEFGDKHKILGGALDVATSLSGATGIIETARRNIKNAVTGEYKPVNKYGRAFDSTRQQMALEEGITKDMGEAGKFLTTTGLSIGKSLTSTLFGPQGSLFIMSSNAASQGAYDVLERGGSAEQALAVGLASGATEYLTEKIPMERFFDLINTKDLKNAKELILSVLKQMGTEGSEEVVSQYVNDAIDRFAMGDKSNFNALVDDYMKYEGLTREQAVKKANKKLLIEEPLLALLGGVISGGVMGGAGNTISYFGNRGNVKAQGKEGKVRDNEDILPPSSMVPPPLGKEGLSRAEGDAVESVGEESVTRINDEKMHDSDIKSGEYEHFYDEKHVSKEFIESVNPEIEQAIVNIRNNNSAYVPDVIPINNISNDTKIKLGQLVGFDVNDYSCKIEKDSLEHIENRHGINGKHDTSLSDPKDMARIEYVINNFDSIDFATDEEGNYIVSKKYNDKNNNPAPIVVLTKKIDGTFCVSQVVPDSKRKTIWVTSARIQKADVGSQVPNGNDVTPQLTPEAPLVSSSADNIIQEDKIKVNNSNMQEGEENIPEGEEVTPHQSAEPTASPQGEAFGARDAVESAKERIKNAKNAIRLEKLLEARYGAKFKHYYAEDGMKGFYENGVSYINDFYAQDMFSTSVHEFLHQYKDIDGEGYLILKKAIENDLSIAKYNKYKNEVINDLKNEGIEYDENKIDDLVIEEAISDIAMEIFKNPNSIDSVMKRFNNDLNVIEKLLEFIRGIANKIKSFIAEGDFEADDSIRSIVNNFNQIEDVFNAVLASGAKVVENQEASEGVRYRIDKSFKEQVDETLHSNTTDRNHVYIGKTTSILKQVGLNDLPMLITRGHLRDIHHDKVEGITKYHGISEELINELPKLLDYPAIIFDSISEQSPDSVCVLSYETDEDGLPILIAIKPDGSGKYNNVTIDSNIVKTMFGKDNPQAFLNKLGEHKENILFVNMKRTQEVLKAARLYLPAELKTLKSNSIIHKSKNVVNTYNTQNGENNTQSERKHRLAKKEEMEQVKDFWAEYINKYGAIPKGENPTRDVEVPKKVSKNKYVSRFARTMMEAGITPDETVSEFEEKILKGKMTYERISNASAAEYAKKYIKKYGFEDVLKEWYVWSKTGKVGKNELAIGMELYNQCVTQKDAEEAMKIAATLAAEATRAGQTVQALRMLKLMSPDGQLYYIEKSLEKMNEDFEKKVGKKYKEIKINEKYAKEFFSAKDDEVKNKAYDKLCQDIADQIPPTFKDKWDSWRYLAMLGNPRTHIRNIVGNFIFTSPIKIKNYVGAVLEVGLRIKKEDRTKAFWRSKKAREFAKKDFELMKKELQGVNAKYALTSDIEGKRRIFKNKYLEKARTKNFDFLEAEDMWFLKRHYIGALSDIISARGLKTENLKDEELERARVYAIKRAQEATYRDANALAAALNKIQRSASLNENKTIRVAGVLMESVMPFKKTPLNIAKQGVYYSPYSILSGIYKTVKKMQSKEAYSTTDIIDDFAKGLTGSCILLLGLFLQRCGLLSGSEDEKEKKRKFDKMVGEQAYSLNIFDSSYTVDWAAPISLPLFVGCELGEVCEEDKFEFKDLTSSLAKIYEPLLELSVFSGISDAISSAQYNETDPISAVTFDMVSGYFGQALPTLSGQISKMIDGKKRNYYYNDQTSPIPKGIQNIIGQASGKIPFLSKLFEVSVDEWGRDETYGNVYERIFENTVSPGYYSKKNYTDVDKELKRLYEATDDAIVFPAKVQKYYTYDHKKYDMNAKDYTEVKRIRGKKSFELVFELISREDYKKFDDNKKASALEKVYKEAGEYTKSVMLGKIMGEKQGPETKLIEEYDNNGAIDEIIEKVNDEIKQEGYKKNFNEFSEGYDNEKVKKIFDITKDSDVIPYDELYDEWTFTNKKIEYTVRLNEENKKIYNKMYLDEIQKEYDKVLNSSAFNEKTTAKQTELLKDAKSKALHTTKKAVKEKYLSDASFRKENGK